MNLGICPKRPLVILITTIGLLGTLPASATVIDGLTAQTSAQAGTNAAVTNGPNLGTTTTSALSNDIDTQSQANASSFGNAAGPYGASSNGRGIFNATGRFIRQWDITNDSGVAQNYSFNFFIYGGSISAFDFGVGGNGYAEYQTNIFRDGAISLFSSTAKITSNGTLTTSGTTFSGATQSGSIYLWSDTYLTIDLGVLNPGDFTSVQYDLIGHSFGNYGFVNIDCGDLIPIGIGDGGPPSCPNTGWSQASLGDPNTLNTTPIAGIGVATQ
ncbi:MAG: hypothetical protein U1B30_12770, partial [Pseudomonadota bacterium]|nr:hypothetical protein [Pseudomonadota bacterium]